MVFRHSRTVRDEIDARLALVAGRFTPWIACMARYFDDVRVPASNLIGEEGKGFAVVATEVRALAQRSAEAATEIKALITQSAEQVDHGVELVGKTGKAITNIVQRVSHISTLISSIAGGAVEQSAGLNEISAGVSELDLATQKNAAMVGDATAAGQTLHAEARKLSILMAHFETADENYVSQPTAA